MIEIKIPLKDVIIDVEKGIDLSTASEPDAIRQLTEAYKFLPIPLGVVIEDDVAIITFPRDSSENKKNTRLLDRATKEANRGRYSQTVLLLEQYLENTPTDVIAGQPGYGFARSV